MNNKTIDFRLYLITDRKLFTACLPARQVHCSPFTAVKEALKGGARAIQLREKDLGTRELLKLANRMRELTKRYNAKLFINDRLDIALAAGADGVHLAQNSIPVDAVRKAVHTCLPPACPVGRDRQASRFLIGVSTHSLKEAVEAEKKGADFITLGPVYRTPSKLKYGAPLGIETLKKTAKKIKIPVFAIGGVKINKVNELRNAGAYGVAVISEIFRAEDIKGKTKELIRILESEHKALNHTLNHRGHGGTEKDKT
jgi:thiamine-phosphate pyrophosphorylase